MKLRANRTLIAAICEEEGVGEIFVFGFLVKKKFFFGGGIKAFHPGIHLATAP
jgi:hypothetical protein